MKKLIFTIIILSFCINDIKAQSTLQWDTVYNDSFNKSDLIKAMTIDANGDVIVTGCTAWNTSSNYVMTTIKYNGSNGNTIWKSNYDGVASFDQGNAVVVDASGDVYVAGQTRTGGYGTDDYVTIKYNGTNGSVIWSQTYNGTQNGSDVITSMVVDNSKNVYVTGYTGGTAYRHFCTIKYNSSGVQQWMSATDTVSWSNKGSVIGLGSNGYLYVVGPNWDGVNLSNQTDLLIKQDPANGNIIWKTKYIGDNGIGQQVAFDISQMKIDQSSNIFLTGSINQVHNSISSDDYLTIKYDGAIGDTLWTKLYPGSGNEYSRDLVLDQSGNPIVTGGAFGDYLTIKYDGTNGNTIWQNTWNNPAQNDDDALGIAVDALGNIYVTGQSWYSALNGNGWEDVATVKYDGVTGSELWVQSFNYPGNDKSESGRFIATDGNGCLFVSGWTESVANDNDYLLVKYCEPLPLKSNFSYVSLCWKDSVQFMDASIGGAASWLWNFGDPASGINNTSSLKNPFHIFTSAGTYNVTLIISNGSSFDTLMQTVIALSPSQGVNAGIDITIMQGANTTLSATGSSNYVWSPSTGLNCTSCQSPIANPDLTTTYYLTATDSNGCTNTDSVTVYVLKSEIKCSEVFIPTAFSPNNDGQNEVLYVRGNCIKEISLKIYDRWGEKVFETTDIAKGWDGAYGSTSLTTSNRMEMNTEVFIYYLNATLSNGDQINRKGNISLIR